MASSTNTTPAEPDFLNFAFYGTTLPVIATLGMLGNIFTIMVLLHPKMRSFCTFLTGALLIWECVYLIATVLTHAPTTWLHRMHTSHQKAYWVKLDYIQRIFIGAYPVREISWCLIVWYTVSIIIEQCLLYRHPYKLARWSRPDCAIKITITISIFATLVHLITFFKFVRVPTVYGTYNHKKICFSQLYRDISFQVYDRIVYYVLFIILPTTSAVILLPKTVIYYRESQETQVTFLRMREHNMERDGDRELYQSGHSIHANMALGIFFLLSQSIIFIVYLSAIADLDFSPFLDHCNKLPVDGTFLNKPPGYERTHVLASITYCCLNLPLWLIFSRSFRELMLVCLPRPPSQEGVAEELLQRPEGPPVKQTLRSVSYIESRCEDVLEMETRRMHVDSWMRRSQRQSSYGTGDTHCVNNNNNDGCNGNVLSAATYI